METRYKEDIAKYETQNPISRYLLKHFFMSIECYISDIITTCDAPPSTALSFYEAGCGNGYVTEFIENSFAGITITAVDIDEQKIAIAKKRGLHADISVGSIFDTKRDDNTFDCVVCTEVLEHLDTPEQALRELLRISRRYLIVSVPNEPIWRVLNMARLKYVKNFGNTPGHVNHWSGAAFVRFIGRYCDVIKVSTPLPWTILLCEKRV